MNEGFSVEDFKTVIDKKYNDWKGTEWEKYLRPETLFGAKFESYLNQKEITKQPVENKQEMSEADSLRSKGYNPGFCDWLESITL